LSWFILVTVHGEFYEHGSFWTLTIVLGFFKHTFAEIDLFVFCRIMVPVELGPLDRVGPSHWTDHCVSSKEFKTVESTQKSNIHCTTSFLEADLA
jgi:hypothetical protein